MTKVNDPYLTIINKFTKYNPEDFKDFEYDKVRVRLGDWGKKKAKFEKNAHQAYEAAYKDFELIGAELKLNSARRSRFDQIYTKIEKFIGVLKSSKSIKRAYRDTKNLTANIGYSEHLSALALDIRIDIKNIPDKIKERYSDKSPEQLKEITKRLIMEKHGFILSYPLHPRLTETTGLVENEVWHWRYIGPEHSQRIAKLREKVTSPELIDLRRKQLRKQLIERQKTNPKLTDKKIDELVGLVIYEEIFLEDYVQLLESDITANSEEELLEQYAEYFIKNIINFNVEDSFKL